jgi:septum site-determining protein MinC
MSARGASRRACELKAANFALSQVLVYRFDLDEIAETLRPKVEAAPELLRGAALVVDLNAPQLEALDAEQLRALLARIEGTGLQPVALSGDANRFGAQAQAVGLPLLGKGRSVKLAAPESEPLPELPPAAPPEPVLAAARSGTQVVTTPVRAGQQIYARGKDLVVLATVNAGAEVIADGSIHVYGRLSGRAIAGALGEPDARVFARQFNAEIVSIGGTFRVLEDVEPEFKDAAVQAFLDGDRLKLERLS